MGPDKTSKLIASYEGIDIYATMKKPSKAGKQSLWISIRQKGEKPWRKSSRTLTYLQAADLEFERMAKSE